MGAGRQLSAYFHRPGELCDEIAEAGLEPDGPIALEGLAGAAPGIDGLLDDETHGRVPVVLRRTEREPTLLGMSGHLLALGRRREGGRPRGRTPSEARRRQRKTSTMIATESRAR